MPISVVVCTLNEAFNIEECLDSVKANHPREILVIDAQSEDFTARKARNKGAAVTRCARKGLAYQRYLGTEKASQPYVAFVDADDVLDEDCLHRLLLDLEGNDCAAVQAISRSYSQQTYWERAMESLNYLHSRKPGPSRMVGRPALYRRDVLRQVGIDKEWGRIGNEDTDLAIRYELHDKKMWIGSGYSSRKHARSLREWLPKWQKYGRGDAKLMVKYPGKRRSILHHQLINYPVILSLEALRKGCARYVPFYILFGWMRFFFMMGEFLSPKGSAWQE